MLAAAACLLACLLSCFCLCVSCHAVAAVAAQVRHMLAAAGRLGSVVQVVINPSDEAAFNVLSTVSKREDVKVRGSLRLYE